MSSTTGAERTVRDIRRRTRKQYSAEEKIRIVLSGLRGEDSIAVAVAQAGTAAYVEGIDRPTPPGQAIRPGVAGDRNVEIGAGTGGAVHTDRFARPAADGSPFATYSRTRRSSDARSRPLTERSLAAIPSTQSYRSGGGSTPHGVTTIFPKKRRSSSSRQASTPSDSGITLSMTGFIRPSFTIPISASRSSVVHPLEPLISSSAVQM